MSVFVSLLPVAVPEVEKVHSGQLQTTIENEKIVVFVMSEILENYYRVHELGLEMNCC